MGYGFKRIHFILDTYKRETNIKHKVYFGRTAPRDIMRIDEIEIVMCGRCAHYLLPSGVTLTKEIAKKVFHELRPMWR